MSIDHLHTLFENSNISHNFQVKIIFCALEKIFFYCTEPFNKKKFILTNRINSRFGPYMSEILTEIDHRSSQFKQKPKGPLGKYVTLVEPKWACATEECFKNIANNFLCCSQEDAATLRKIFDILKIPSNDRPTIVVSRFTGIKYEDLQQPGYQFKTLYRTLAFSDVDVQ